MLLRLSCQAKDVAIEMQQLPFSLRFINGVKTTLAFVIPFGVAALCAVIMDLIGISSATFNMVLFCGGPAIFTLCFLLTLVQDWNEAVEASYDDFIGNYEKFQISWAFVKVRFNSILFNTGVLLACQFFLYIVLRIGWGCLMWLKTGEWIDSSTCRVLEILCYNNTSALGLNKILDWFGNNDAAYPLMAIMFVGLWFIKIVQKDEGF